MNETKELTELKNMLLETAKKFTGDPKKIDIILNEMAADIQNAVNEKLEIFPVCHHSPASGIFMVKRLLSKRPKVIFLELCEDLQPLINELDQCKLPVALQAFASDLKEFDPSMAPLSVVAPITEFSAEYQAISYALNQKEECAIVFVDHPVDHMFKLQADVKVPTHNTQHDITSHNNISPNNISPNNTPHSSSPSSNNPTSNIPHSTVPSSNTPHNTAPSSNNPSSSTIGESNNSDDPKKLMHGSGYGISLGNLRPRFPEFEELLLKNAKVRHYSEWWNLYVEQPLINGSYDSYRYVMFMIGSLFRHLGNQNDPRLNESKIRERHMWTRIKEYLNSHQEIAIKDCIYVCGAFHSAQDVPEFGVENTIQWNIPKRTETKWLYGIIPSSFSAIEYQFGLASGSTSIAATMWKNNLKRMNINSFSIGKKIIFTKNSPHLIENHLSIKDYMLNMPDPREPDFTELIKWCVNITAMARKNDYLASTADAIAIYQTTILLANIRNRLQPSVYDFQDAAVTCLEKEVVSKKRDIRRLCEIMLGDDRIGMVGYHSLPPLAQDIYDRLNILNIDLNKRNIQRVLMDFNQNPELHQCSDLFWKLLYLIGKTIAKPIMGQKKLGFIPQQESWDIAIGRNQRLIIELGYEGVTIEYVIEQRLKKSVYSTDSTPSIALEAVENSILYLNNEKLTENLGLKANTLMKHNDNTNDAPNVYIKVRILINFFQSTGNLPTWLSNFVKEGYSSYCALLPKAFANPETPMDQISSMLGFIINFENIVLSLGGSRNQFIISIKHSIPSDHAKTCLLWTAEYVMHLRELKTIREHFDKVLGNNMLMPTFPESISGFIAAMDFCKSITPFVVELISKAFTSLPEKILLPWFSKLILFMKNNPSDLVYQLISEAAAMYPDHIDKFEEWTAPWELEDIKVNILPTDTLRGEGLKILQKFNHTCSEFGNLLGINEETNDYCPILKNYPDTLNALNALIK